MTSSAVAKKCLGLPDTTIEPLQNVLETHHVPFVCDAFSAEVARVVVLRRTAEVPGLAWIPANNNGAQNSAGNAPAAAKDQLGDIFPHSLYVRRDANPPHGTRSRIEHDIVASSPSEEVPQHSPKGRFLLA